MPIFSSARVGNIPTTSFHATALDCFFTRLVVADHLVANLPTCPSSCCVHTNHSVTPQVHAVQTNEIFLLVGEVMAQIASAFFRGSCQAEIDDDSTIKSDSVQDLAQDLALTAAVAPFADFVQKPWWDVAVSRDDYDAADADLPLADTLRALCEESSALLRSAFALSLGPLPAPLELALSAERFGRVVGTFEQNNVGVRAPSPIPGILRELLEGGEADGGRGVEMEVMKEAAGLVNQMVEEGEGCSDDDDDEWGCPIAAAGDVCGDDAMATLRSAVDGDGCCDDDSGEGLFAPLDGTALYSLVCCMNHSCRPNCEVRYPGRTRGTGESDPLDTAAVKAEPLMVKLVLLEDVSAGAELTQSYITKEMGLAERRRALEDYGFLCMCPRCSEEEAQEAAALSS